MRSALVGSNLGELRFYFQFIYLFIDVINLVIYAFLNSIKAIKHTVVSIKHHRKAAEPLRHCLTEIRLHREMQ